MLLAQQDWASSRPTGRQILRFLASKPCSRPRTVVGSENIKVEYDMGFLLWNSQFSNERGIDNAASVISALLGARCVGAMHGELHEWHREGGIWVLKKDKQFLNFIVCV